MKKIVVKRADGGVSIVIPTGEATPELLERDALQVEGYVSHREIDDTQLPADRIFRNAWTDDYPTDTVDVHVGRAQDIKYDTFRQLRKPIFEKLDVAFMLALEKGDTKTQAAIASKKQALRDITKIKLPDDVELLAAFTPSELM